MNRIIFLLVLALTIGGTAVAQPSKVKKKTTIAKVKTPSNKTAQQKKEEEKRIAAAKAVSTVEKALKEAQLAMLLDSISVHTGQAKAQTPYQPKGWVNDYVRLFTLTQQTELDSLISAFEKATTVEIAIVTIDSAHTNKNDFDNYVTALGKRWGVGKKETNNGVVIGICPGLKRIRISTGRGITQQLTDEEAKAIIDNITIPQYKKGNYFEGTKLGLLAVMQELKPTN
jgi:uncharacterized protein